MILTDDSTIMRDIQLTIRRELDRRGRSLKVIAIDSGIPYSTVLSYFPGDRNAVPHILSAVAIRKLTKHVGPDLMSLILDDEFQIIQAIEGDCNHDAIADACRAYLAEKDKAHRLDSPGGREITDDEDAQLRKLAVVPGRRG